MSEARLPGLGAPAAPETAILSWSDLKLDLPGGAGLALPTGALSAGEVLVLLGPSGCGKSTLLRVLIGDLAAEGAEVKVASRPLHALDRGERPAHFSVLRQENGLIPDESALTNCLVGRYSEPSPMERAKERLRELGIPEDRWDVPVSRLSGGQQRRVALARTLVVERPIRVFDEPTTGLDPQSVEEVAEVLAAPGLWKSSCGLVVTHDEGVAAKVGTLVGRVRGGRVKIERLRPPYEEAGTAPVPESTGSSQVFYTPGWVYMAETRRTWRIVAPLLAVCAFIIGATLLAQSAGFARMPFGRFVDMPRTVVETILRSLVLEVVPLVVGLLYAGIGGASIAGKNATMATTGVRDTLWWMGRDPGTLFGVPTVVAALVGLPLIEMLCAVAAVVGAGAVMAMGAVPLGMAALVPAVKGALAGQGLQLGMTLVKSAVFAIVVSVTGYRVGAAARGGADAVAGAAALSVLIASLAVVTANALLTLLI